MNLRELINLKFEVKTDARINPLVAQVATTLTQLLTPNPNRLAWTLINLGANPLYVAFTPDVSTTKGVYVSATGGVFGLIFDEDFDLVAYPVYAIAVIAAAAIYLVEIISIG